jgi:ribosome-binding factor A
MVLRYSKSPTQRQLKVAEAIRHAISEILIRGDLLPPLFDKYMISVSEVRISSDLKVATAFLILPDEANQKDLLAVFKELGPEFRRVVSSKVNLRFSPEIRFVVDDTVQKAAKIETMFKKLHK